MPYQATDPELFHRAMNRLSIDPKHFSFLDIGCGKGRALLLARDRGFQRIIGVEVSARLAAIARLNSPFAEIVESDAVTCQIPDERLVVYMYNPFSESVVKTVAEKIARLKAECWIVYMNPTCSSCFGQNPFNLAYSSGKMRIWHKFESSLQSQQSLTSAF